MLVESALTSGSLGLKYNEVCLFGPVSAGFGKLGTVSSRSGPVLCRHRRALQSFARPSLWNANSEQHSAKGGHAASPLKVPQNVDPNMVPKQQRCFLFGSPFFSSTLGRGGSARVGAGAPWQDWPP